MIAAESVRQDLRIGLRLLVKERTFCALAVVVLALGICGVATMFSLVNGIMLRGFNFPDAERLATVAFVDPTTATFRGVDGQIAPMDFEEFLPQQTSFESMAAYLNGSTVNVTVNGHPQRYTGAYMTDRLLSAIGVAPILGRDFRPDDNKAGAEKVALISYAIWQRDFGAAPDIVGHAVRINGKPATIIGVMPQGFSFPTNEDLWLPLYGDYPVRPRGTQGVTNPSVLGKLKRGVSFDQANAEFATFAKRFAEAYPATNRAFNAAQVEPLLNAFTNRPLRSTLLTMLLFCVGVLLIACVNVMNMQFARATLRAKELAIRSTLGATRLRLMRQMLTESLLLAGIGAALGVALAWGAVDWLGAAIRNLDNPPPAWMAITLDPITLVVTIGATLAAAVVSGLLPAWMSSRANAADGLRDAGRGNTSHRARFVSRGLVVFQIVVTCVLLIGSLLQLRSLLKQQAIEYGYDTSGILSARMGLMDGAYPTPQSRKLFFDRLVRNLRTDSQFEAVALTNRFRMVFSSTTLVEIEGRQYKDDRDRPNTNAEQVTGGFFDVTGQKLTAGRTFTDDDSDARLPVAIVNAAFAQKHFGGDAAIGRRFRTVDGSTKEAGPWRTIVGVVSTIRMLGPFNNPGIDETGFYLPFYSTINGPALAGPFASQFATVIVKPRGGLRPENTVTALRGDVTREDADLPLYFVGTPRAQIDGFVAPNRIIAGMFTIFGVVAVILAAVGIYGVMSFTVNQRTQEFGVRMALGADQGRILSMVMRQGSTQIAAGVVLGVGLAFVLAVAAGNGIQSTLFGVSPRDPLTYSVVIGVVTMVSLIATLVPARRATRVDPIVALRAD